MITCRVIQLFDIGGFARELHCWAAKESDINQRLRLRNICRHHSRDMNSIETLSPYYTVRFIIHFYVNVPSLSM